MVILVIILILLFCKEGFMMVDIIGTSILTILLGAFFYFFVLIPYFEIIKCCIEKLQNKKYEIINRKNVIRETSYVDLYSPNEMRGDYPKNHYIVMYLNRKYPTWHFTSTWNYRSRCWNCKKEVVDVVNLRCKKCGWLICSRCGSCKGGCNHGKEVIKLYREEIDNLQSLPNNYKLKEKFLEIETKRKNKFEEMQDKVAQERLEILKELAILKQKEEEQNRLVERQEREQRYIQDKQSEEQKKLEEIYKKEKIKIERERKKKSIKTGAILLHKKFGKMTVIEVGEDKVKIKEVDTLNDKYRIFAFVDVFLDNIEVK